MIMHYNTSTAYRFINNVKSIFLVATSADYGNQFLKLLICSAFKATLAVISITGKYPFKRKHYSVLRGHRNANVNFKCWFFQLGSTVPNSSGFFSPFY